MSPSSLKPNRQEILEIFERISGLPIVDCLAFLNEYNWRLEDLINDHYQFKDSNFRKIANSRNGEHFPNRTHMDHENVLIDQRKMATPLPLQKNNQQNNSQHEIYHEKQIYYRCGLHALNNLFQSPNLFTAEYLDSIVRRYDRRMSQNDFGEFYFGDYDLTILMDALKHFGFRVQQINYLDLELFRQGHWDSYFGILMNINRRHWFSIKRINEIYYNLDSMLFKPKYIGKKHDLIQYLIDLIQTNSHVYIFAVILKS